MARNGKFVIKQGRGGKSHFVLLASNGRVVVTSETYESKQSCLKGIDAVKRLAADAAVIDDGGAKAPTASKRAAGASPRRRPDHRDGTEDGMYGGMVRLVAEDGRKSELLDFLRWDAEVCRAVEPGTLRFDVWESPDEPDVVYLYETYADQDAFAAHMANEPFKKFVDEVVPTLREPPTFVVGFTNSYTSNADE